MEGPDFNSGDNLHPDTVAERYDSKLEDDMKSAPSTDNCYREAT